MDIQDVSGTAHCWMQRGCLNRDTALSSRHMPVAEERHDAKEAKAKVE
jgi:hypothetical protein